MRSIQFRALYRVFLLRIVDFELLSSDADPVRLIGQFLTIFATISFFLTIPALFALMGGGNLSTTAGWTFEHFLIETAMTVAGIIAILNWDAAFPDRRDALVLSPLPVKTSTLFCAKISAFFAAPFLAVLALSVFTGITWPFIFSPRHSGIIGLLRSLPAYWLTIFVASAFIVLVVLALQGLAANLLPRQLFLRLSAVFQAGALCVVLLVYFLGPSLESTAALTVPQNQRLLAWLPSYWFLGLFQQLNGSMHPALAPLARQAWIGVTVSGVGAAVALLLSYFRALPRIVEQPDILPIMRNLACSPRIGNSLQTAISLFTFRTLLRSRQHRTILSFYLGIGLAIVVACLQSPLGRVLSPQPGISAAILFASILMLVLAILAIRVVAAFPITLPANWIIRITQLRPARSYQRAVRLAWIVLGIGPVWIVTAALFFLLYPWQPVIGHLAVMLVLGVLLVEICLYTFPKIPFTCSYLPGKANIHFVFWASILGVLRLLYEAAKFESVTLRHLLNSLIMLAALASAAAIIHTLTRLRARRSQTLLFEEEYPPEIVALKLN